MKPYRLDATVALVVGYLTGVTVAFVMPVMIWSTWTGRDFFSPSLFGIFDLFFFGASIAASWVIVSVPFFLMHTCGGLRNAWLSVVGGVTIAFLALPLQVGALILMYPLFGEQAPPFYDTLVSVAASGWQMIMVGGATGGLTYWSIQWLFTRLFLWASNS
jgi:hypothetical protein